MKHSSAHTHATVDAILSVHRTGVNSDGLWTELARLPHTRRYLIAYMAFNDAIQTVITVASVFLAQELFVSRGLPANEAFLMGLVLMVQFVAFGGALLFERIAVLFNTKNAILFSLVIWTGIVVYAYGLLRDRRSSVDDGSGAGDGAWRVSGTVAIAVLADDPVGTRSGVLRRVRDYGARHLVDRSLRCSASSPRVTGSYRHAILSLVVLFLAGMVTLLFTDTVQAIRDAGNRLPIASPVPHSPSHA